VSPRAEVPRVVGRPLPKVDAAGKVTGRTRYADDLKLPRMLHGKILRSPRPHARIVRIDTSRAEALPGVRAVLTGRDLPTPYGILPVSQDEHALALEKVRFVGDPVAAVAADDEETAARAIAEIEVEYEDLPAVFTLEEALAPAEGEARIHAYGERGNIHRTVSLRFGPLEEGFAAAAYVREDVLRYAGSTHLPMEEHCAVAEYGPDGKLTLWSSTQVPHYVHRTLARVLGLSPGRIRVVATPVGGGFGGKTDPFPHEIVACKLAMITGRPVKIALTREEVFACHRGRHPVLMWFRTGFTEDGRITAMRCRTYLEGGAYGSYGVASLYYTGALQTVAYRVPAYGFEGVRVFTNVPPCGPKRGHATPQPRFALEVHLDKAAVDLGISPAELRRRLIVEERSRTVNWLRITSCGLRECLERVVEASGFEDRWGRLPEGRGVGLACSAYLSGAGLPIYWNELPHSSVTVEVDRQGGVTVLCGATDVGQGSDTVLATTVAEVLGLDPQEIRLVTADTERTPVDLGSYSSRVTFMMGNAALEAASRIRELVLRAVAEELGVPAEALACADGHVFTEGRSLTFAEAARLAEARFGGLSATGSYTPPPLAGPYKGSGVGPSPAYSYSACVVEVEADPETGIVVPRKVWLAHDVGRAINPLLVEGQIEGSVSMALGEALMEEQAYREGRHRGPSMLDYKSPTVLDMPEVEAIIVETHDPEGPFGAKEVGQGPLLPVPPALCNAVHDALGVRIDEVPVTPEKVLKALERKARGEEPRVGPAGVPDAPFRPPIVVEPPPGAPTLAEVPGRAR
jgi:4-hydroxybenzoyl-CoA reductase alpha subunit